MKALIHHFLGEPRTSAKNQAGAALAFCAELQQAHDHLQPMTFSTIAVTSTRLLLIRRIA